MRMILIQEKCIVMQVPMQMRIILIQEKCIVMQVRMQMRMIRIQPGGGFLTGQTSQRGRPSARKTSS